MKNIKIIVFVFLSVFVLLSYTSCDKEEYLLKKNKRKITIEQGIAGTLIERSGNLFPGSNGKVEKKAIQTKIRIYELMIMDTIIYSDYFPINSITTELITTVESDKNGFYQIFLPEGKYTMLIEYTYLSESGLYGPMNRETKEIMPITISPQNVTIANILFNQVVY